MGSYTKLTLEETSEILGLYGRPAATELVPLSLGISNSNYRVETPEGPLLLKVSNDKSSAEVEREQQILLYLHRSGYPYSLRPFMTSGQKAVYQFGEYHGVLFPFLEGIPPGPSDRTCFEIGRSLAHLHSLPKGKGYQELRHASELGYDESRVASYSDDPKCPSDFREHFLDLFPDRLEKFHAHQWEENVTHGDLYYDNTLFHNDHLSAVLDFEQGGRGSLITDLGISISGCCLEKDRINVDLVKSYLEGYEKIRSLPDSERNHLDDAIHLGLFSIALWRIKRFKEGNLNPLLTESYKELLMRSKLYQQTKEMLNE